MADKHAPKEVDLKDAFAKEAKDPAMIAYLKSLGTFAFIFSLHLAHFCLRAIVEDPVLWASGILRWVG
jgi:hypothetical protein